MFALDLGKQRLSIPMNRRESSSLKRYVCATSKIWIFQEIMNHFRESVEEDNNKDESNHHIMESLLLSSQ
jgi:hypothetical protein